MSRFLRPSADVYYQGIPKVERPKASQSNARPETQETRDSLYEYLSNRTRIYILASEACNLIELGGQASDG